MPTSAIHEINEHNEDLDEEIELEYDGANPQVTFYPPLFLQRRIWILDILRRESIVDVCDHKYLAPRNYFALTQICIVGARCWVWRGPAA